MKNALRLLMTAIMMVIFGVANASTAHWYGYARTCLNGEDWQHKFITFTTQNPQAVQPVSETLPELWAATYVDGYVWFVTQTRNLCKIPFDEATQTFGNYEVVVPTLDPYNLIIDMAYNPANGMMYFLCQDSQYNSNLKRCNLASPSSIETMGYFNERIWTLAINRQGQAYGVSDQGGNLYQIDLSNAATMLVGPTGKELWYTQSMAFDLDTGELFWAHFSTTNDNGLYQVNPETGAATSLGTLAENGVQLTGLFMVPQLTPPEPEIISEIHVEGFTVPVWGEHPDYDLEVSATEPYTLTEVTWHQLVGADDQVVDPEAYFDQEETDYYLVLTFSPNEGFVFDEQPTVYFDGDPSVFGYGALTGNEYWASTIDYQVTDLTSISEQRAESVVAWPNPVLNRLYLEGMDGEMVSLYDPMGRLVMRKRYEGALEMSALASGVYVLKVKDCTIRLVKE